MLFPELPAPLYVLFLQALYPFLKCLAVFLFFQALRHLLILFNTPPELLIRYRELIRAAPSCSYPASRYP